MVNQQYTHTINNMNMRYTDVTFCLVNQLVLIIYIVFSTVVQMSALNLLIVSLILCLLICGQPRKLCGDYY